MRDRFWADSTFERLQPFGTANGYFKSIEAAAEMAGMSVLRVNVRNSDDIERGFAEITSRHIEALVVLNDPFLFLPQTQDSRVRE